MAKEQTGWQPSISDEKLNAATGRGWMGWFTILNKANAAGLPHGEITALLRANGAPRWWNQMIAVEYERARGGRQKHEKADGYSVSVTKVMPIGLAALFAAATDPKLRAKWFPKGAFEETSKPTTNTGAANGKRTRGWRLGFYSKGAGKSQIALQVNKLLDAETVEKERAAWKKAFEKLQRIVSK